MRTALLLARLVQRVAPPRHRDWAAAMAMEIVAIERPAALPFAWGCLRAAVALRIEEGRRAMLEMIEGRPRAATITCGVVATLAGMVYLLASGAPAGMLVANGAALVLGLALAAAFGALRLSPAIVVPCCGAALLATAFAGASADGAARWVRLAGVAVQPSLVLLPLAIVLHVAARSRATTAGIAVAALAMAIQPDRAMAGTLLLALLAVPRRSGMVATLAAGAAFGVTLLRADDLPAGPWVDGILFSAPRAGMVTGVAVWGGIVAALLPVALAFRSREPSLLAFAACWTGVVAAAALGNYPTPLVGFGGSAILGYLLAAGALPVRTAALAARRQEERSTRSAGVELPKLA